MDAALQVIMVMKQTTRRTCSVAIHHSLVSYPGRCLIQAVHWTIDRAEEALDHAAPPPQTVPKSLKDTAAAAVNMSETAGVENPEQAPSKDKESQRINDTGTCQVRPHEFQGSTLKAALLTQAILSVCLPDGQAVIQSAGTFSQYIVAPALRAVIYVLRGLARFLQYAVQNNRKQIKQKSEFPERRLLSPKKRLSQTVIVRMLRTLRSALGAGVRPMDTSACIGDLKYFRPVRQKPPAKRKFVDMVCMDEDAQDDPLNAVFDLENYNEEADESYVPGNESIDSLEYSEGDAVEEPAVQVLLSLASDQPASNEEHEETGKGITSLTEDHVVVNGVHDEANESPSGVTTDEEDPGCEKVAANVVEKTVMKMSVVEVNECTSSEATEVATSEKDLDKVFAELKDKCSSM